MSLRAWDRKIGLLQKEISKFAHQYRQPRQNTSYDTVIKKMRRAKKWQFRLEKNLAFIQSLVRRKHFLSTQDKTLLHWAREFTEKTALYYRDYLSALNTLLWAKMVQTRSMSITFDSQQDASLAHEGDLIQAYQQQLRQNQEQIREYLRRLAERKNELRQRYEALVISYINDEAQTNLRYTSGQLTPVSPYVLDFKEKLNQATSTTSLDLLDKITSETNKMARLTLGNGPRKPAFASSHLQITHTSSWQHADNLFRKFDYMNLEDEFADQKAVPPTMHSL